MKEFDFITGAFDLRKKKLIVTDEEIILKQGENKTQIIKKSDLKSVRYGIEFISGYKFYIGREYIFYFKANNGESIKVNFKSFYRHKLEEKHQLYNEIINTMWDLHLYDLADFYLHRILNGEVVNFQCFYP